MRVLLVALALAATNIARAQGAPEWQLRGKDLYLTGMPPGGEVTRRLIGPARDVRDLDGWLTAYADRDAPQLGRVTDARPPVAAGKFARSTLRQVATGSGAVVAAYVGRLLPGGTVVACRLTVGQASIATRIGFALNDCLKTLDDLAPRFAAADRPKVASRVEPPQVLASGGGLRTADIAEVLFRFEMPTMNPFSGMLEGDDDTYLLLRDGRFYFNFNVAPAAFDVAALRQKNPGRWGRWRRVGAVVELAWDDGRRSTLKEEDRSVYIKPCRPARPGETMNQTFTMMSTSSIGYPGSQSLTSTSRSFAFRPDGSFGSRGGTVGLNANTTVGTSSANVGRYRLDGYTLALQFPDGRREQRQYCRVETGSIVVNGVQLFTR